MFYFKYHLRFVLLLIVFVTSCAYYNILFNAKEKYESGQRRIKESNGKEITPEMRKDFYDAIDKCWKLINIYGDSSTYADDALLLIGKSHYQVEEYVKSERYLRQFLSRYPKSDFRSEANLWLGKSLIYLDRDDEATLYLNETIEADESAEMTSQAYLSLGDVQFKQKNYKKARTFLDQVIEISRDDDIEARAWFLVAESFFEEGNYPEAEKKFDRVSKFKTHIDFLFDAFMRRIDCMMEMNQEDQVIELLDETATNNKFLHKNSILNARIGDVYKDQGKFIEATEEYDDVLRNYPRTEGSAIAAYGMAQLMEFTYADLDTAKSLYQRVGQEYRQSDLTKIADERSRILDQYQKIDKNIQQDLDDIEKLNTLVEDSALVAFEADSTSDTNEETNLKEGKKGPPRKPTIRTREELDKSLEKNRFAKAEFFLLTLVNNDSAIESYTHFVTSSQDSLLVPKAYYALYYIYAFEIDNPGKADSIRQIILRIYPNTSYAAYFNADKADVEKNESNKSPYNYLYLQGEAMMYDGRYEEAIDLFSQIAVEDSGSDLARKARYASAWIYEKNMEDIPGAVHAYTILAQEYPQSEMGKIAKDKIKVPENDPPPQSVPDSLHSEQETTIQGSLNDSTAQEAVTENWPTSDEVGQAANNLQEALPDSAK